MDSISLLWSRLWNWKNTAIDGGFPNHPVIEWLTNNSSIIEGTLKKPLRLMETLGGWKHREDFADIQRFTLFIGHPRSGHSLVGALLDAHPQMIVAHELDALESVRKGVSKRQLFFQLLARSQWFKRIGANWGEYSYAVPSQYKGEYMALRVIGDKKGGKSTDRLRRHPDLLEKLWNTVRVPLHVIHVKRHPLDNISTMTRKGSGSINKEIEKYFEKLATVRKVRKKYANKDRIKWIEIEQEGFVKKEKKYIKKICKFLDVDTTNKYLKECASIVFNKPKKSRTKVEYSSEQIRKIRSKASKFECIKDYEI